LKYGDPDLIVAAGDIWCGDEHPEAWRSGDLAAVFGENPERAAYAYAEIELEEARDLVLHLGSNDGFLCWFNGEEAGRFEGGRTYRPDQDTLNVKGRKGRNIILVKVSQQGGGWARGVCVTDKEGESAAFGL
jgi:hypothetical protein